MPSSESAANTKISTDVNNPSHMTIQSCNALTTTTTIGPSSAGTTDTVTKTSSASAILAGKVPAALETIPEIGSCGSNPKDDHGDSCEDSGKSPKELIKEVHRKISLGTSAPQHTYSDTEYLLSSELLDATSLILTPIELPEALALSPSCTSEQLLDAIVDTENVLPENELRRTASDVCVNVAEHNIDVPIPIIIAEDVRRVSSVADILPPSGVNNRRSQNQRVRFFLEAFKGDSGDEHTDSSSNILDSEDDTSKHGSRARLSSFRDLFRGSRRGKKKKTKRKDSEGEEGSDAHQGHTLKAPKNILKKSSSAESKDSASDDVNNISFDYSTEVEYDSSDDHIWSRAAQKSTLVNNFRRCHSAKCRKKPNYHGEEEDDDFDDVKHVAYSVTEENSLIRGSSFIWRFLHLRQPHHGSSWSNSQFLDSDDGSDVNADNINDEGWDYLQNKHSKLRRSRRSHRSDKRHHDEHSCRHCQPISVKHRVLNLLDHLHLHHRKRKEPFLFSCPERNSRGRIVGHSLASVELGSWAARGSRRGSSLTPFCAALSPAEASSRSEILQTISSSIIHLFQRKSLKENELGALQEHVRFLINSEAGNLVHEYYKDQLLRKGMIILREKIKNEQGLDLLRQLGETWDYFFKEILPSLQAILYPLTSLLGKDETVRSLSLLAFRNIVVLKVSIKEALDSVEKRLYPSSMQQMLLVLQSIQDNVFLSENQFLLEKLVARVVCPYLGQRGVYEGSPDPVIKVKLKPIPFNIPSVLVPDNKVSHKAKSKLESLTLPSTISPRKGGLQDGNGIKKLKPVLEHVYDGGRRHSIMS